MAANISVLSPQGVLAGGAGALAERLATLDGAVLGFIDNGKPNSDVLFARLRKQLSERFRLAEIVYLRKPLSGYQGSKEVPAEMAARCHAIIVGVGD